MSKEQFIADVAKYVIKYAASYGIKVHSPIIAQAILESNWGNSKLTAQYHNYFGLKCGSKWTGKSVNLTTQEEYSPGTKTTIKDNFRVYDSVEEGIKGYFEFIQLERYQNLKGITDPKKYLETIRADGYATSSTYVKDTYAIVTQYNLTKYDKEKEVITMSDIDKVIAFAERETGYLEKSSKAKYQASIGRSDEKTYGAGSANWTKYGAWIGCNGDYWCASFISYIFGVCFGQTEGKKILGTFSPACETIRSKITKVTTPRAGDIIFFSGSRHAGANHIGLVTKVTNGYVYTIEGNTSGGSTVVDNGGGVAKKCYARSYSKILSYGRPKYNSTTSATPTTTTGKTYTGSYPTLPSRGYFKNGDVSSEVCKVKKFLNWSIGSGLTETNKNYFDRTALAVKTFQKKVGITADGKWGSKTQAAAKAFRK